MVSLKYWTQDIYTLNIDVLSKDVLDYVYLFNIYIPFMQRWLCWLYPKRHLVWKGCCRVTGWKIPTAAVHEFLQMWYEIHWYKNKYLERSVADCCAWQWVVCKGIITAKEKRILLWLDRRKKKGCNSRHLTATISLHM